MSAFRPLPPRPSLEFEHKEAKALLRRLRAPDSDAIARAHARHPAIDASTSARAKLADAQLVIAREYGFTSWPRLVHYFEALDRQRFNPRSIQSHRRDFYDGSVRALLAQHRDRQALAARSLTAYVPRFYGLRAADVFASTITEDDARLAVARDHGCPSWEVLLERVDETARRGPPDPLQVPPLRRAEQAMAAADLRELRRVVEAHPDLLRPSDRDASFGSTLLGLALRHEQALGAAAMRPIVQWLVEQGLDLQHQLNAQLCGHMNMKTETVRHLLDRGADPNWMPPNGIPVLEHAIIRYWNGEAVDLVAERVVPRRALWIAAGLGDVDGVHRSLDAHGKPTPAARRLRPDFDAVGPRLIPSHPDPDDDELLMEAFSIAMLNGRTAVLEYMVSRGFPVNTLLWSSPVINVAVGNAMTSVVECLVRCGADLDLEGQQPNQSARELAREMFENASRDARRRRIVELCGMDPDAVLAERDARPLPRPEMEPRLREALELASDDAFRLGQADVRPENLLLGLLRSGGLPLMVFAQASGVDVARFRADVMHRVRPTEESAEHPALPLHADAQAMIQAAVAVAAERRRETVRGLHLLYALTRAGHGAVADLLARYGSSAATVNAELDGML